MKVTVKFFADLRQYGPEKAEIDLPDNSTVNDILEKYKVPKKAKQLIIMINTLPRREETIKVNNGDVVAIFPIIAGG